MLLYAPQSLKDVFYLLSRTLKKLHGEGSLTEQFALSCQETAWACVENMASIATCAPVDEGTAWIARHLRGVHADLEDNMILACLENKAVECFVTNDASLLGKCAKPAFTPETFLEYIRR